LKPPVAGAAPNGEAEPFTPGAERVCPIEDEAAPPVDAPKVKGAAGEAGGFDEVPPNENPVDAGAGEAGGGAAPKGDGFEAGAAPKVKGDELGAVEVEGCPNEKGVEADAGAGD
jgi:hypothetical protein